MGDIFKGKPMVLLVDDEEDLLFLVQHKLQREGFDTRISPNGINLMDIITQTHPDLIVLDIHMTGIDGGTICQLIKSNSSTADIPIIMFSANENVSLISKECGADGFIGKPFNAEKFKDVFQDILKRKTA